MSSLLHSFTICLDLPFVSVVHGRVTNCHPGHQLKADDQVWIQRASQVSIAR